TALEQSEAGNLPTALDDVEKAERIDANVAQVEFLKGTLLGQLGQYEEAAATLGRTLALNPRYTAARFKLALTLLRLGRTDRAADALHEVVRQQPDDFRAWHNLAAIAYSRGDLDDADTLERKALSLSPGYAEGWNTLGAIALVRKRTDVALEALTKATELAPKNAQAFKNLSLALRATGQVGRADAAADRACVLDRQSGSRSAAHLRRLGGAVARHPIDGGFPATEIRIRGQCGAARRSERAGDGESVRDARRHGRARPDVSSGGTEARRGSRCNP